MNGLALLGIVLIAYAALVFYVAIKKPDSMWDINKIRAFRSKLGDKGTVIFFMIWGVIALGFGIWLLVK